MNYVYNLEFSKANACFDSIIQNNPDHPLGYYLKCSAKFFQIVSGYDTVWTDDGVAALHEEALAHAQSYGRMQQNGSEGLFFEGCIYGNLGRYWAAQGDWLKAFYYGNKSKSLHQRVIGMDSSWYDAYLTLGIYHYYAATLPKWVKMIVSVLGVHGDKDLGMEQINRAARFGNLANTEADFMLANIYTEEGEYEKALTLFDKLQRRYPGNVFLILQKAYTYYLLDDWKNSEALYDEVLARSKDGWASARFQALYYKGRLALLRNQYVRAAEFFWQATSLSTDHQRLKTMEGWIAGHALYYSGECAELSGSRADAVVFYKKAGKSEIHDDYLKKKIGARIARNMSDTEIRLIRARRFVLTADTAAAQPLLDELLSDKELEPALAPEAHYYKGRLEMIRHNYAGALFHFNQTLRARDALDEQFWIVPYTYYYCAVALNKMDGKRSWALESIRQALMPDDYQGEKRLKVLCGKFLDGYCDR